MNDGTERFFMFIEPVNGCWNWVGGRHPNGYGVFYHSGKSFLAHRMSLLIRGASLVDGLVVDHKCRNRICVNPRHLRQVTRSKNNTENSESPSAVNKRKTICVNGHPFTAENTQFYSSTSGGTSRSCRICGRAKGKRWRDKIKRKV